MNLGPAEILVILVIALLVFGPSRLPEVGRQVGTAMRELRKMQANLRSELDEALREDQPVPGGTGAGRGPIERRPDGDLALPAPGDEEPPGTVPHGHAPAHDLEDRHDHEEPDHADVPPPPPPGTTPPAEPSDGFPGPRDSFL